MTVTPPPVRGAVLVVYPFCLDHVGHGNIQRILAIARYLALRGLDVDLVYQASDRVGRVDAQYASFRTVFAVEPGATSSDEAACTARLQAFYSGHHLPPVHMRPSAPLTTLVRSLLEAGAYRAVVATYAFTAPIFTGLRRPVFRVCDVQDVMHEHADACQKATGVSSSFTMPSATEAFLWRQWDALIAITPDDRARIARDLLPGQHLLSARHAALCAPVAAPGVDDVALYAASDNQSNVQSVTWLLEQVWPHVRQRRPQARLRMAGLICAALPDRLRQTPGLELLGFRDQIDDEVAACGVLVAPYLYGSGLKIKVVEAACAGKAIVTTTSGRIGTGLHAGRALEVHDDPVPFAEALARLLGDGGARLGLAEQARVDAASLFSATACYEPIVWLLRMFAAEGRAASAGAHVLDGAATARLRLVVDHTAPRRLVVWGNGAFTRALLKVMAAADFAAPVIVDGRATDAGVSPEGLPVLPKAQFAPQPGDLLVLSSETFEHEMWRDLARWREAGAQVLGLCHPELVSRAILDRLSGPLRAALGVMPVRSSRQGRAPAVVFWDSGADASRWWRTSRQRELAAEAVARGTSAVVVCRAALASRPDLLDIDAPGAEVLPVIECSGEDLEAENLDGGVRALAATAALLATTSANTLSQLHLADTDVLVLLEPSLSECLALAHALRAAPVPTVPSVAVWTTAPERTCLHLAPVAQQAYWRLALGTLADAAGGRFAVVTPDAAETGGLASYLELPVHAVCHPAPMPHVAPAAALARVVCLGPVSEPMVRPTLEALAAAATAGGTLSGATLCWRSDQHDARPGAGQRWAVDLATTLGVTLLDDVTPAAMVDALAGADAIAILAEPDAAWRDAVVRLAAAAAVPVVYLTGPDHAVACVLDAIGRRRTAPPAAPVGSTLDLLRAALSPASLVSPLSVVSRAVLPHAPVTETRQ